MTRAIGIDLGTTFCAVSVVGENGPEILLNREGERITPSVVLFLEDEAVVGSMAKQMATSAPEDVVQFVKRNMGDPHWTFVTSGGEEYGAEWVSAIILRRLKEDAELALGAPVTQAVITVPAYFDDARRRATQDAGEMAGLEVLGVINEPTAAALAHGLRTALNGRILVYDLGGGTFDVTVMDVRGDRFEVLATRGDRNLGGFNWDNELIGHLAGEVQRQTGVDLLDDDRAAAELRDKAETVKRTLTTVAETKVFLRAAGRMVPVPVTRELFASLTRGLLARTRSIADLAVEDARLDWSDIDHLLLVGGSTRMPMVGEMLSGLTGLVPLHGANPDELVALGAAIRADLLTASPRTPRITIQDVTALGLGVIALDTDTGREGNHVLVPRNTAIPADGEQDFVTTSGNQTEVLIQITEGDDEDVEFVQIVGSAHLRLPPRSEPTPMRIVISFDADAVIFAEVFHRDTGAKLGDLQIDRSGLSRTEVEQGVVAIRGLAVN
ncbi:Hsp70 family protein [Nakamurella flavida]|uniref:Hsp70 family protein n=1 Tax=Nakamurella flavida TaxID=363630 RepID=A0A938YF21_9ACTN|nr:Hsp70 family protein [Nakamurella flavida]MBM9476495.1 Hsp70 family protein [Nakamurella flavida]MDP9779068.1 molecular chaperone DnaK [Nakamurella flavida]